MQYRIGAVVQLVTLEIELMPAQGSCAESALSLRNVQSCHVCVFTHIHRSVSEFADKCIGLLIFVLMVFSEQPPYTFLFSY